MYSTASSFKVEIFIIFFKIIDNFRKYSKISCVFRKVFLMKTYYLKNKQLVFGWEKKGRKFEAEREQAHNEIEREATWFFLQCINEVWML